MEELIKEFMAQKKFAIVGATDNPKKYGNKIFKNLKSRGYEVYPVNPRLEEIEGVKCYKSLSEIPVKVDVVDIVVPPHITEKIVEECKKLGLSRVWIQPGAESEKAIKFCKENNIKVVYNLCIMQN
jgi:predicted CoA-binding protein